MKIHNDVHKLCYLYFIAYTRNLQVQFSNDTRSYHRFPSLQNHSKCKSVISYHKTDIAAIHLNTDGPSTVYLTAGTLQSSIRENVCFVLPVGR